MLGAVAGADGAVGAGKGKGKGKGKGARGLPSVPVVPSGAGRPGTARRSETTMRVPPWALIGDSACTRPPMATTSSSTMARPSPEPSFREAADTDWYKRSKTLSRSSLAIPACVFDGQSRQAVGEAGRNPDAGSGVLQRVLDDVADHLSEPVGVSFAQHRPGCGGSQFKGEPERRRRQLEALGGLGHDLAKVDRRAVQAERPGLQLGQFEQVRHQAFEAGAASDRMMPAA